MSVLKFPPIGIRFHFQRHHNEKMCSVRLTAVSTDKFFSSLFYNQVVAVTELQKCVIVHKCTSLSTYWYVLNDNKILK